MIKEEAIMLLKKIESKPSSEVDPEQAHITADRILLYFLKTNGYDDLAEAYESTRERIGFFYS
jgi:hypothetical protein